MNNSVFFPANRIVPFLSVQLSIREFRDFCLLAAGQFLRCPDNVDCRGSSKKIQTRSPHLLHIQDAWKLTRLEWQYRVCPEKRSLTVVQRVGICINLKTPSKDSKQQLICNIMAGKQLFVIVSNGGFKFALFTYVCIKQSKGGVTKSIFLADRHKMSGGLGWRDSFHVSGSGSFTTRQTFL